MVFRGLIKGLAELCLAGAIIAGTNIEARSAEFAEPNQNIVTVGFETTNQAWTYGPKFNENGPYVQIGRGFGNVTGYIEAGAKLPVINQGFFQPGHPENFADISPNCFVGCIGVGARTKFYENTDSGFSVCGDLRFSRIFEFPDYNIWPDGSISIFEIHGITSIDAKLWAEQPITLSDKEIKVYAGASVNFGYAAGDIFHRVTTPTGEVNQTFYLFNQRNKANTSGVVGFGYPMENGWTLNATTTIGSGTGVDLGFSRTW